LEEKIMLKKVSLSLRLALSPVGLSAVLAAAASLLPAAAAHAQYTFRNVAQTGTTTPGGATFTSFATPRISGGNVAFRGTYTDIGAEGRGIYRNDGTNTITVAATGSTAPGGGTFTGFGNGVSVSGSNVAFEGSDTSGGGIYRNDGTNTISVVRRGDDVPRGGTFADFAGFSISGSNVAFAPRDNGRTENLGVFRNDGSGIISVAQVGDITPNGGTFTHFGTPPSLSGSNVVFQASYSIDGRTRGIFLNDGINPTISIARQGGVIPGIGTYNGLSISPVISGSNVAFVANYTRINTGTVAQSIFLSNGTDTRIIAEPGEAAPRGGTFFFLGDPSISGSNIAFQASENGTIQVDGLFAFSSTIGGLTNVIRNGDTLFGSTVTDIDFGTAGLDGDNLAFHYTLANGTSGIAVASIAAVTVPESSTFALALPALGMVGAVLVRRRKK
jgi:hypothetical protein